MREEDMTAARKKARTKKTEHTNKERQKERNE